MGRSTVVAAAFSCLLYTAAAQPAAAQAPADDRWHVTIAPYMMGAGLNGTAAVLGQDVTVDASFSDILNNLQFGAMGLVVARKGNWGVGGEGRGADVYVAGVPRRRRGPLEAGFTRVHLPLARH
jgi:hypothetical protein